MTEYGTIRIPKPAYEHHNEIRKEIGLTWEQYLNQQGLDDTGTLWTEEEIREIVRDEFERAQSRY